MIKVEKGTQTCPRIEGTSLGDIYIDKQLRISYYQGSIGANPGCDIIVKYHFNSAKGRKTQRQPKHIHWVVDLLMKRQGDEKLTGEFLNEIEQIWNSSTALVNNDFVTINEELNKAEKTVCLSKYKSLDNYGEYSIEFLFVLLCLFVLEEKTSSPNAYMFIGIIRDLQNKNIDIYDIVRDSTSRYK